MYFLPAAPLFFSIEKKRRLDKHYGSACICGFQFTKHLVHNKVLDTILEHLVDFWSRFGARWILKGPNRQFSETNIKQNDKNDIRAGGLKTHYFF